MTATPTAAMTISQSIIDRFYDNLLDISSAAWDDQICDIIETVLNVYLTIINNSTKANPEVSVAIRNLTTQLLQAESSLSQSSIFYIFQFLNIARILDDFRSKLGKIECYEEIEFAQKLLSTQELVARFDLNSLINSEYGKTYGPLIDSELHYLWHYCPWLRNDNGSDTSKLHFVFVGSGALPMTAILFAVKLNCKITCLDNNEEAIIYSRQIVERIGLTPHIIIEKMSGEDYIPNPQDIIWLSILSTNKETIIKNYNKFLNTNSVIAARSVNGLLCLLYEPINRDIFADSGFEELGINIKESINVNHVIYYRKI